tara:strand:+ start:6757 stop:6927 length:171 start_codon:yes stop_codon:yes gene_type:complete
MDIVGALLSALIAAVLIILCIFLIILILAVGAVCIFIGVVFLGWVRNSIIFWSHET